MSPDELHALDLLNALSDELSQPSDARTACRAALIAASKLCAAQRGTVHVSNPHGQLGLVTQVGFDEADLLRLETDLSRVGSTAQVAARQRQIVSVLDFQNETARPESILAAEQGYRAAHSVPVLDADDRVIYVFTFYFQAPRSVSSLQSRWVTACAKQLTLLARRAHNEQVIAASEERFRSIFQESNDFIVTADLQQKITYCNPATAAALGWPTDQIVGRSISDFIPPPHFTRTSAMLDQKLRDGGSTRYEVDVIARDGRRMTWEINSRLTFDADGKPTGLHAIGRDVTSMRAAHEALRNSERRLREADQRKDEFLAMLAHELRNPLAPIRTAAEVFKQPSAGADQLRQASAILERQVAHITRIVEDLLDVSRVTRGLVTLEMKPTNLQEVITLAVEQVRPLIEARQHRLRATLPEEPVILSGEAVRLVQMVANLLNNAARHSGRSSAIDLSVVAGVQLVEIHVRDDGAGIAPELLPRIFDLFAQSDQSAARSEGGLGIGLALVRRVAELHGGHVEAHSEGVGRGAHFIVVLPRLAEERQKEVTAVPESAAAIRRPLRILVVDDNEDAASMLSMLLQLEGHETFVANDARSALIRADAERPDVMLLDIGLPDMSGYELGQKLRATSSTSKATLIAVTGYGQAADQRRSKDAGFDHHLTKPVSGEVLRSILATVNTG